jgi:putative NIF3 family GTP cyclohydrolase 1 type 2
MYCILISINESEICKIKLGHHETRRGCLKLMPEILLSDCFNVNILHITSETPFLKDEVDSPSNRESRFDKIY